MSHQTGIRSNDDLKKFFGKCKDGSIRVFKVSIENEELVLTIFREAIGTWEEDFEHLLTPLVEDGQPSYILYRLDSKDTCGYDWMLVSWSPDDSSIRQKMLYASTKATLKQEFGSSHIKDELHATCFDDVTLNGFCRHKRSAGAPVPLTSAEEELAELRRTENVNVVSIDTRHQTLSGVAFPLTDKAWRAIEALADKSYDYVQLKIDMAAEEIHLAKTGNVQVTLLAREIPTDEARYHLYNFKHTHEGDYLETLVFIYSMPGYTCSIKERMLYSSCKATLIDTIEARVGLQILKKLEVDSADEVTESFLQNEIHPKKNLHRPKFAKPKGPPNRGAKRLTKPQQEN